VLCEFPECFPGLILLCEITNENANAQFFRPLFAKGSEPPAMMNFSCRKKLRKEQREQFRGD
jgi:hypothetical protein